MSIYRLVLGAALAAFATPALAQDMALVQEGHQVFDKWCLPCHGPDPRQHPGTNALKALYGGEKPAVLEERDDITPDITRFYVRNGVSIMPFFRKTEISDSELEALAAYLARDVGS